MKKTQDVVGGIDEQRQPNTLPENLPDQYRSDGGNPADNQNRYAPILEILADAVVVWRDQKIIFANAAAVQLHGADAPEQLIGMNGLDLIHPDDRGLIVSRIAELPDKRHSNTIERRGLRLDGSDFLGESLGSPCDWDGAPATRFIHSDYRIDSECNDW